MSGVAAHLSKVVPAQLSFLGIYNPSLGNTDETFHNQVVFYYSKVAKARPKGNGKDANHDRELREEENEKLRQIGLAQGMVNFARSFSNGEAVDSVETEKSRIVMHELEVGWWILASIDLTRLPISPTPSATLSSSSSTPTALSAEYSSREVSPPALLLQHLHRAHSIFLLHHGSSLSDLYVKLNRSKFCNILDKFWTKFANSWDVMLHGSPAVDIFGGLKLASGGELGMGVGEEEWGSGEREVLEDYARRTDGLVDLIVSRFGEPSAAQQLDPKILTSNNKLTNTAPELEPWMGSGRYPGAADGVVFSGVGAITRASLKHLSQWIEWIYGYGEYTYGVKDNPSSDRRKRRRKNPKEATPAHHPASIGKPPAKDSIQRPAITKNRKEAHNTDPEAELPPGIPPPIVSAVEPSLDKASSTVDSTEGAETNETIKASLGDPETWVKYLTLGYGSTWGGKKPQASRQVSQKYADSENDDARSQRGELSMRYVDPEPDVDNAEERLKTQIFQENIGYFIVGLKGDMENDEDDNDADDAGEGDWNSRILLRTLHVELAKDYLLPTPGETETHPSYQDEMKDTSSAERKNMRLRVIVYVHRPFIYTFLFHPRTTSLTLSSFYRNLHTYFSPLHRPLSNSTSPNRVAARIAAASNPYTTTATTQGAGPNTQPIFDLVYDPRTLTVHSSIPNIPEPGTLVAEGLGGIARVIGWSRVEALNVHSQILTTVAGTRHAMLEIERTCKTSRGWWVVWMRLPPSQVEPRKDDETQQDEYDTGDLREAFLVRRVRDSAPPGVKSVGSRAGSGMWRLSGGPTTGEKMGGPAAGWGPRGLAEGIGIDARRYVEGLLSLNR